VHFVGYVVYLYYNARRKEHKKAARLSITTTTPRGSYTILARGRNNSLTLAIIHEQSFPIPHYCGIGDLPRVCSQVITATNATELCCISSSC